MSGSAAALVILALGIHPAGGQTAAPTFSSLSRQADEARNARQFDKAIGLYQKALKLNPRWEDGWWSLGSIDYDLDRFADGAPAFLQLARLKPDSAPAWTMAGLCQYKLRSFDDALKSFAQASRLGFQEPTELARAGRLHLALVLTKTGSFEKAITELAELTRIDHKSPEIIVAAGIAGLRRVWLPAEVPESDRSMVFQLGDAMAAAMEQDYKLALQKFEAVVAEYPDEPNIHFRFGAFLNLQDSDRGIGEIQKAIELAPGHVPALVGLTMIYIKREDTKDALEYGRRAVQAAPGDFAAHIALGRALLANENPAEAAAELEQAVKLAPEIPEARYSLASAYTRLGRKSDATRELGEFKRLENLAK